MLAEGLTAARQWLTRDHELTYETSGMVFGIRPPEKRLKAGLDVPYEDVEVACLVVDEITLGNGKGRERYRKLQAWKKRGEGRSIALFVPRDLSPSLLVEFRDVVVTVTYPLVSFSGSWLTAQVSDLP